MFTRKILIISTNPFSYDGISNVIVNYHERISDSKLQFDIAISKSSVKERVGTLENIFNKVYVLPERKQELLNYSVFLFRILNKTKYDIIHVHGNSGTIAIELSIAYLSGVKKRIAHSHNSTCDNPRLHKYLKPILNKLTTSNFACSTVAGDWLFSKPYTVLNNGINTTQFLFSQRHRDYHREKLNFKLKTVIGHVGHFTYQKNHDFLIQMYKELRGHNTDNHLLLIGDGPLLQNVKDKINEYGLTESVTILNSRNDVNELLSAIDIFVLPSHFEGLPLSGIEAQAAGLCCLVSDKISSELSLTDSVNYLSISDTKQWIEFMLSYKSSSRIDQSASNVRILQQKGYDITSNANILTQSYISMRCVDE